MGPGVRYWEQQKPEFKGSTRSQKTVCSNRTPPPKEKGHLCMQIDSPRHLCCFAKVFAVHGRPIKMWCRGTLYISVPGGDGNDSLAPQLFASAAPQGTGRAIYLHKSLSLSLGRVYGSNILFPASVAPSDLWVLLLPITHAGPHKITLGCV